MEAAKNRIPKRNKFLEKFRVFKNLKTRGWHFCYDSEADNYLVVPTVQCGGTNLVKFLDLEILKTK